MLENKDKSIIFNRYKFNSDSNKRQEEDIQNEEIDKLDSLKYYIKSKKQIEGIDMTDILLFEQMKYEMKEEILKEVKEVSLQNIENTK